MHIIYSLNTFYVVYIILYTLYTRVCVYLFCFITNFSLWYFALFFLTILLGLMLIIYSDSIDLLLFMGQFAKFLH